MKDGFLAEQLHPSDDASWCYSLRVEKLRYCRWSTDRQADCDAIATG